MVIRWGKFGQADRNEAIKTHLEQICVCADIPHHYLGCLFAAADQQKSFALSKSETTDFRMTTKRRTIRLNNFLRQSFPLLILHDEQVTS